MSVVSGVDEVLNGNFEIVLVVKVPRIYLSLNAIKSSEKVDSTLLITRRGIFKVCYCALKFERIFVVFEKLCSDSLVEGNADKAIIYGQGSK